MQLLQQPIGDQHQLVSMAPLVFSSNTTNAYNSCVYLDSNSTISINYVIYY